MNIYDFDNTIFKGDSSVKFIKYSLIKFPIKVNKCLLKGLRESIKYVFKKSSVGLIKSEIFSFVKDIDDLDDYVKKFILKYEKNIKKFYLEQKKEDDVVISASFDFIVRPFCESLGIKHIIATKYDTKTGKITGKNCKGEEKIVRFKEVFKNSKVNEAYSDSLSDIPMFKIAKKAFVVKDEKLIPYE